jgi:hypothetical protein
MSTGDDDFEFIGSLPHSGMNGITGTNVLFRAKGYPSRRRDILPKST